MTSPAWCSSTRGSLSGPPDRQPVRACTTGASTATTDSGCTLPRPAVRAAPSRTGDVACERPADERVGVPVPHAVLGLQVPDEVHVLVESAARDDLLPLRD